MFVSMPACLCLCLCLCLCVLCQASTLLIEQAKQKPHSTQRAAAAHTTPAHHTHRQRCQVVQNLNVQTQQRLIQHTHTQTQTQTHTQHAAFQRLCSCMCMGLCLAACAGQRGDSMLMCRVMCTCMLIVVFFPHNSLQANTAQRVACVSLSPPVPSQHELIRSVFKCSSKERHSGMHHTHSRHACLMLAAGSVIIHHGRAPLCFVIPFC